MKFSTRLNTNEYIEMDRYQIEAHIGPLYEILLPEYPVKPHFDLDRSVENYNKNQFEVETNMMIENAKIELSNLYERDDIEWAVESNSGEEANGTQKLSVHMVAQNIRATPPLKLKQKLINHGEFSSPFDLSIYRKGISKFRVGGFEKDNSIRTPIIHSGSKLSFLLTNNYPLDAIYEKSGDIKENKIVSLKIKKNKKIKNKEMKDEIEIKNEILPIGPKLRKLLDIMPADNYDEYIKVGMFLKGNQHSMLDWGLWAAKSEKYNSSEIKPKWDSFSKDTSINLQSIDFLARRNMKDYIHAFKIPELKELFLDIREDYCADFLALNSFLNTVKIVDKDKGDCWVYNERTRLWSMSKVKTLTNDVNEKLKELLSIVSIINSEELKTVWNSSEKKLEDLKIEKALYKKAGKKIGSFAFCSNVVSFLKGSNSLFDIDFYKNFSSKKNLLAVKNGCVDLSTGIIRPRDYTDYFTNAIDCDYNPDADTSQFLDFLLDIFTHPEIKDTNSLIYYLKRALGYMATKETKEQVMFMAIGFGANGKGVLTNCLFNVLGENVYNALGSLLDKKVLESSNCATPALMSLENKTLCIINEVEDNLELGAAFKKLVDNGKTTGRQLYGSMQTFDNTAKLFVSMNDVPKIPATDNSYPRRLVCMPFKNTYKREGECKGNDKIKDIGLETRLLSNKEGILKYIIDGAKLYYDKGCLGEVPIDMADLLKDKIADDDWAEGLEFTKDPSDTIRPTRLMAYLKDLNHLKGRTRVTGKYIFKMIELGATRDTNSVWCGVKIKDDDDDCVSFDDD